MKVARKFYINKIELFDYLLALESEATNKSMSALVEEHVLNDLTKSKKAMIYIERLQEKGLHSALKMVFSDLFNQTITIKKDLLTILFDFAFDLAMKDNGSRTLAMEPEIVMLPFPTLMNHLENILKNNVAYSPKNASYNFESYDAILDWMARVYDPNNIYIGDVLLNEIYQIVYHGWNAFYNQKATYQLLANLESMLEFDHVERNSRDEWAFIQIIVTIFE